MWFEPIFLSGFLVVFKFAAKPLKFWGACRRRRRRRNAFELFSEYSTSKNFASVLVSPRFARRPNCREFWAKKSIGGFTLNLIQSKRKFFQIIIN